MHPPQTHPEAAISQAAGLEKAIVFRTEGGPDDELDDPAALTMSEAIRLAVVGDPGIQAALARVQLALADAKQARLLPNPIINLAVRFPQGGGKPAIEASLAQDIISILRIPRQSSAADNRLRSASVSAITTMLDLLAEVQERYASVQALEEYLRVLDQQRGILDKVSDVTKARLSSGEGVREEVMLLDARRVELDVEIAETQQELRSERLRLSRLIGHPSGQATWRLEPWTPPLLTDVNESAWIAQALQHRPEIQEKLWLLAALGDELALASLSPFDGASAGIQSQRDPDWQVGPELSVPLPIFDMGQARADRASAEQVQARHEMVEVRRQVIEDVRQAFEALDRSRDNVKRVREQLLPLEETRRSHVEAAFKAGHSDITALFIAEQNLRAAHAKAVAIDRKAAIAAIRLQRAVGGFGHIATPIPPLDH